MHMDGLMKGNRCLLGGCLALLLGMSLSGCESVKPWQRGTLAKSHMAPQPFGAQAEFREHIYGSRESAGGSTASTGGGGCGCY
ncbi:MAG: hypothetical protein RL333_1066 [Pseudomonadota bacterium]